MERVIFDQLVKTDYCQFDVIWDDGFGFEGMFEPFFAGQVNGTVGAAHGGGLYLRLARRSGGSPIRITVCDAPPPIEPDYQDVVEVSVTVPAGATISWASWCRESYGTLEGLDPGDYRVRVSSKDRDQGHVGEFAPEPVDAYLVQFWPAPPAQDAIIRIGSADAEYSHWELGTPR